MVLRKKGESILHIGNLSKGEKAVTVSDITNKTFEKVGRKGYRIESVDEFLIEVSRYVTELNEEKKTLEQKLEVLADKLREYREDEESIRAALLGAQKLGDGIIKESKQKAEFIVHEAEEKAESILRSTKVQLLNQEKLLNSLKQEVTNFKNNMLVTYKHHLELISSLPETETVIEGKKEPEKETAAPEVSETETVSEKLAEQPVIKEESKKEETKKDTGIKIISLEEFEEKEPISKSEEQQKQADDEPKEVMSKYGPLKFGSNYDFTSDDFSNTKKR